MGRLKSNIDWKKVDTLLKAQCDGTEIAAMLGLKCADTLYRHVKETFKMDFVAYSQQKRAEGRTLLKVAQFDKALTEKSQTMQIWLGKQYLGQKDRTDNENRNTEVNHIIVKSEEEKNELTDFLNRNE